MLQGVRLCCHERRRLPMLATLDLYQPRFVEVLLHSGIEAAGVICGPFITL